LRFISAEKFAGPMSRTQLLNFLKKEQVLMRLAMIDTEGYPIVHPVWFVFEDGEIWAAIERTSRKARLLKRHEQVYFTIDKSTPQPKGVRGRGIATLIDNSSLALEMTKKHLLKYHGSLDDSFAKEFLDAISELIVVKVTPLYLASWDYSRTTRG
jgi:general stress protein 26